MGLENVTECGALFPTSYFPSISLMASMLRSESLTIEVCETFPKQTDRNRTVIVTANGPMTLSVPIVRRDGNHTTTGRIGISYAEPWNRNHWRAIVTAYSSSPFFLYYRDDIEEALMRHYDNLIDLNDTLTTILLQKLKCPKTINLTTDFVRDVNVNQDYRNRYSYKHPESLPDIPAYEQVFGDRMAFNGNVSVLDTLFNLGPEAKDYLLGIN